MSQFLNGAASLENNTFSVTIRADVTSGTMCTNALLVWLNHPSLSSLSIMTFPGVSLEWLGIQVHHLCNTSRCFNGHTNGKPFQVSLLWWPLLSSTNVTMVMPLVRLTIKLCQDAQNGIRLLWLQRHSYIKFWRGLTTAFKLLFTLV